MIKVTNNCSADIKVKINRWGDDGSTSEYEIAPYKSDSWDRSDQRGFIMCVDGAPYFVSCNSNITVDASKISGAIKL